jgi:hypothetical protein
LQMHALLQQQHQQQQQSLLHSRHHTQQQPASVSLRAPRVQQMTGEFVLGRVGWVVRNRCALCALTDTFQAPDYRTSCPRLHLSSAPSCLLHSAASAADLV